MLFPYAGVGEKYTHFMPLKTVYVRNINAYVCGGMQGWAAHLVSIQGFVKAVDGLNKLEGSFYCVCVDNCQLNKCSTACICYRRISAHFSITPFSM